MIDWITWMEFREALLNDDELMTEIVKRAFARDRYRVLLDTEDHLFQFIAVPPATGSDA